MRQVCDLVAKIAPTGATVLIRGEPGVGKRTVAQAIHRQSRCASGPFVHVNCMAIHEAELSAQLFGIHERDVEGNQQCLLQQAKGGTVFLSQIQHLPLWAQVQLLDALRSDGIQRYAGSLPSRMDVRVIASTSGDLEAGMAEGRIPRELYYCLNVIAVRVPPLRERPQDFEMLAQRCLAQTIARQGAANGPPWHFTAEAWECLRSYDWPDNLPELASVVAHAVAMSDGPEISKGVIDFAPIRPPDAHYGTFPVPLVGDLRQIERSIIDEVIRRCGGNKAAAARALGLHRRTLYRLLEEQSPKRDNPST
jgi:two-component system response regulator HydG